MVEEDSDVIHDWSIMMMLKLVGMDTLAPLGRARQLLAAFLASSLVKDQYMIAIPSHFKTLCDR